ncbi:MAG TPA: inositol monophosphatase family protein [Actinomycetes bacterium]
MTSEPDFARSLAHQAGEIMRRYFRLGVTSRSKGDGTPVTAADEAINEHVMGQVKTHFPDDAVIGEEGSSPVGSSNRVWVCDPIDGTLPFTLGVPTSLFSLDPGPLGEPGGGFRRYGHSKDHRPDLPQVVIGLAVTKEGIQVRVWCWPGNTADTAVLPEVRDGMREAKLGRVVTVVDRGFSSDANLDYLRRGGGGWIAGEWMRERAGDAAQALSRQGRFTVVNDHLHVKEAKIASTPGIRWVICLNTAEAAKDKATRDEALARLGEELGRIAAARAKATAAKKTATSAKARARADAELAGHTRAECALRDHVTLGRWLRQTPTGRLAIDRARVGWTASTCCPPPTRTCHPPRLPWATRTSSKPNAGSGT